MMDFGVIGYSYKINMTEKIIKWEDLEGDSESKYIKFRNNDAVDVSFTNWKLYRCEHPIRKDGSMVTRFTADVVDAEGHTIKTLDSLSMRLILQLRKHIMDLDPKSVVKCKIMKFGEGMNTNYKVFDFEKVMGNAVEENIDVEVISSDEK